ncbi:MAG: EAL domain-containing protein [Henriciella sp.]|nr:EAL domain-containing protein [Henriciella sp.]
MTETLGDWTWSASDQQLTLEISSESHFSTLDGVWTLTDFNVLLDGLSSRRLSDVLAQADASVACELKLADGRAIRIVGGFVDAQTANGIVLDSERQARGRTDQPGPALVPVYQPIFSLNTGKIVGFEALARWPSTEPERTREDREQRFDDKALASNMLILASDALRQWREIPGQRGLFMHVNLTSRDLVDTSLVDLVAALTAGHGLDHGILKLELTEQAALRDSAQAISTANALRDVGASLVLDDFGSGHSSFLWLADLQADSLKVDSDLVARLANPRMRTILESVCLLARRLGMKTTAEGVEDRSVLPVLLDLGFDYAQGYGLGHPLTQAETLDLLTTQS